VFLLNGKIYSSHPCNSFHSNDSHVHKNKEKLLQMIPTINMMQCLSPELSNCPSTLPHPALKGPCPGSASAGF